MSFVRDRGLAVRGPDTVAVVTPMFNEEAGAARALDSLLTQSEPLDEIVISINGGTDMTIDEVQRTLRHHGLEPGRADPLDPFVAVVQRWHHPGDAPRVIVVHHHEPTSKSESVNIAVLSRLVTARRILVVDGDTVLDAGFVAAIKNSFYRLRTVRGPVVRGPAARGPASRGPLVRSPATRESDVGEPGVHDQNPRARRAPRRYVIEDRAMQSGSVRSRRPERAGPAAWWIWLARTGEYAVSAVLRAGQTRRPGRDGAFSRSRLFTVVGCGFVARRDAFPMPGDTRTEDHDFTLQVQNLDVKAGQASATSLDERGFRVLVDGRHVPLSEHLGADTELTVVKSSDACFVDEAVMYTDDPHRPGGLIRQLERWNGGAIESAFKRLIDPRQRRRLRPNVRFTLYSALFENALGLSLLLVLPALLGLRHGLMWSERLLGGLTAWLVLDFVGCVALVLIGLVQGRGPRDRWWWRLLALPRALLVAVPLQTLRLVNAVTYVAACTRVLPALFRANDAGVRHPQGARSVPKRGGLRNPGITWDRPAATVTRAVYARTAGTALVLALVAMTVFSGSALLASSVSRLDRSAWRLTYVAERVEKERHVHLPVAGVTGLSEHCSPALLPGSVPGSRPVTGAGADRYTPLSAFGLLMLGRLAPLLTHLEEAASAYDVDANLLLRVIVNESFLDPLAEGPTQDVGLAQVTSDALTLLRAVSLDEGSRFYNPALITDDFSVFDPSFSLCAGAAKLAWAVSLEGGESDEVAYARYINPLVGVVNGRVADTHVAAVASMTALTPLTDLLGSTIAAYRDDRSRVTSAERDLLDVAAAVSSGELGIPEAYARTRSFIRSLQILDVALYDDVLRRLYGFPEIGTIVATGPEMNATSSSP